MFQYLRVKRQIEKVVPDAGALTQEQLTQDPGVPITLRQINALPENAKKRVYRNHAFEPSEAPIPDVEAGLEDRPIGGFGLFFIYQTMDEIRYQTTEDGNCLTYIKRLRPSERA